jgi:hypothetical protein
VQCTQEERTARQGDRDPHAIRALPEENLGAGGGIGVGEGGVSQLLGVSNGNSRAKI